jgi:multidrug resistance efflux pump
VIRIAQKTFLPFLAVAALSLAISNVAGHYAKVEPPQPSSPPAQRPFDLSVAGTGIVEPCTECIAVGSHVGGIVTKVFVKVNQRVQQGDMLFTIDDRQLQSALRVRQGALQLAQSDLDRLKSMPRVEELAPSAAKIAEAKANVDAQEDLRKRALALLPTKAISRDEFIARDMALNARKQQLARVRAEDALLRAGAWASDIKVAQAAVDKAQAEVQQAAVDIERLSVRAPIGCEVLQVNIRPGEFVAAPQSVAPIVLGDLEPLHVRVDIDEHDISRFRLGSPAKAMVRGDTRKIYPLTFVRVEPMVVPKRSLSGDSAERVDTRVLQVIYAAAPGARAIYVGQQLDVFIDAASNPASSENKTKR